MLDPFGPAPLALAKLVEPLSTKLNLLTLPLHIHEVLFFAAFYQFIMVVVSPALSRALFAKYYNGFEPRTRINWDIHVVSLVQSTVVSVCAFYIIFTDKEWSVMDAEQRVWGYSGSLGLMQATALGYFLWDLYVCTRYIRIFGVGMLAHAMSAVTVFTFGFRPFVNYYCPVFILYELSSPFLNFHWFFDKMNMTGSRPQLYNGIALIITFFLCRLVWGTYSSVAVFYDIYRAMQQSYTPLTAGHANVLGAEPTAAAVTGSANAQDELMRFAGSEPLPLWLAAAYLASNITLNSLNWIWFRKMIAAVTKRFAKPKEKTKMEIDGDGKGISEETVRTKVVGGGAQVLEVEKVELRQRK